MTHDPNDLSPISDGLYLTQFTDAYELHRAASAIRMARNASPPQGMPPEIHTQRKAILDISTQLLVNRRNKALDAFCTAWLRHRQLPQYFRSPLDDPQTGTEAVGGRSASPVAGPLHAPLSGPKRPSSADDSSHSQSTGGNQQ